MSSIITRSNVLIASSLRRLWLSANYCKHLPEKSHRNFSNNCKMAKTAMVILANGSEEMEFVISVDVLRRAGVEVTIAGLESNSDVKCSRDVVIKPEKSLEDLKTCKFNVIVLPGGLGGSEAMSKSELLGEVLKTHESLGGIVAAICAAPTALAAHSICLGKRLTSYPSVKGELETLFKYVDDETVVHDDNLITSRGPGTAYDFALKITEVLMGHAKAVEVARGMLLDY